MSELPEVRRSIKITVTPPGEAPFDIRNAWVGLDLPLSKNTKTNPVSHRVWGVLSGPKDIFTLIKAIISRTHEINYGYVIDADEAINVLSLSAPTAADWWRANAPHVIAPGRRFMFDAEFCELVDADR